MFLYAIIALIIEQRIKPPNENSYAASRPSELMNPRKKLFVPKKIPAARLGRIRNFLGESSSMTSAASLLGILRRPYKSICVPSDIPVFFGDPI